MQPRGIRNNNPLNIRHSADQWQGAREEQKDKSFVQFKTMAYGYRAAWKTLQSYYNRFCAQSRAFTVRNIIGRWAPPKENDTEAYDTFGSRQLNSCAMMFCISSCFSFFPFFTARRLAIDIATLCCLSLNFCIKLFL